MSLVSEPRSLEWYEGVPRSISRQTRLGFALIILVFGGFSAWAGMAPLASAVIAPGNFVATGENKFVQHLEGGIIAELLVHEGDAVTEGQDLIRLDPTAAQTNARQLFLRRIRAEAILARLHAESRGLEQYIPPAAVAEGLADPEIRSINESQRENFDAAHEKLNNEVEVLQQNITALEFQRDGSNAQLQAMQRQRTLLQEEYHAKAALLAKGIVTRPVVSAVERAVANAEGEIARLRSQAQASEAQIARFRKEIIQARDAVRQAAFDEMQAVEAELDAVREQITQARDVLGRTTVKAPVSGTIVRMYYHTAGGVIESGKAILEILPTAVPLIIEAQIPRMQIDEVHEDQVANIRLTALNQRTTPMLEGEVFYVSADSVSNPNGPASPEKEVYLARINIPAAQLARIKGFSPTPGMPAEILIQTHERTFFEYITKPIADSMARAFREY